MKKIWEPCLKPSLCKKTSLVYIPISLAYQDLQDLTPFNVTSYNDKYMSFTFNKLKFYSHGKVLSMLLYNLYCGKNVLKLAVFKK